MVVITWVTDQQSKKTLITNVCNWILISSFQVINSDQKSSSNLFPCFNLVNLSIAWVWVSVDIKNCAILPIICSQVSNRGLLVMINMLRSSLVSFHSFWKSRNFLIWVSAHYLAQLSFSPLIFPKAILILSHSFEISLLWKNNIILLHQALTSSRFCWNIECYTKWVLGYFLLFYVLLFFVYK